jgi:hypothetical protein
MNGQQSPQSYAFSIAPIMKMYMDSWETWKHSYEAFIPGAKEYQGQQTAHSSNATNFSYDAAFASWVKSGEETFSRFVEQQIELSRFFASRWENYMKLPGQLAHCHTPAEMGQVQAAFLSQFASDYMQEVNKLYQPVGELMSHWAAPRHV